MTDEAQPSDASESIDTDLLQSIAYERAYEIAQRRLRDFPHIISIQPTDLVGKAWLRLQKYAENIQNREHLYALYSRAVFQDLIDHVRRRKTQKHGGDVRLITLSIDQNKDDEPAPMSIEPSDLEQALDALEKAHPEAAEVLSLKLWGDLPLTEIAGLRNARIREIKKELEMGFAFLSVILKDYREA